MPGVSVLSHPCKGIRSLRSRGSAATRTDLDALDALGHHVGMMHRYQRHLHPSQPAQRSRPHTCGESSPPELSLSPGDLRWSGGDSQMGVTRTDAKPPPFPAMLCDPYLHSSPRRASGWSHGLSPLHTPSSPQNHQL